MQIFYDLNFNNQLECKDTCTPFENLSLAFGFFDGVHLGHQEVIKSAVNFAKENNTKSAIITFQDHPCCFFYNLKPQYIVKRSDKIKMFEKLGVDYLFMLKFDEYLAVMTASDYLKNVIVDNFKPSAISTGFNHFFGSKRSGNVQYLKAKQSEFGYKFFEVKPLSVNGEVVSSTAIRNNISLGNIEAANSMLGYEYFLEETVVHGAEIGRKLGFRTANLLYPKNLVEVANGVYRVNVEYNGKMYRGMANYGVKPTVTKENKKVLEVHILDFDKDIYDEKIKVIFEKKIRDERKFETVDELKAQIKRDIESCL
jgi:riboflavin kinase/FMN adenylyltransferase